MSAKVSRLLILGTKELDILHAVKEIKSICTHDTNDTVDISSLHLHEVLDQKTKLIDKIYLSNKYYKAVIELHGYQIQDNVMDLTSLDLYEGILCVLDLTESIEILSSMKSYLSRIIESQSYEVCLLVGNQSSHLSSEDYANINDWSIDNGFEYIANIIPQENVSVVKQEGNDRYSLENEMDDLEKDGYQRVVEAMHCHMWNSMQMHSSEEIKNENTIPEVPKVEDKEVDMIEDELQYQDTPMEDINALLELNTGNESLGQINNSNDEKKIEDELHEFQALFEQVQSVRMNGASMTDADRRQKAEEVALKLWSLLGCEESEDED